MDDKTWHDQKPTHPLQPRELIEARHDATLAWATRDDIIEARLNGYRTNDSEYFAEVERLTKQAQAAEQWYADLYNRWQTSLAHPPECNCVLPEQSCSACRAAAAKISDDEFPY